MKLLAHTRARTLQRLYRLARALVRRRAQVVAACQGVSSGGAEVAITRKVIRSDGVASGLGPSVALRAWVNIVRCLDRTAALWVMVFTILDHVCARQSRHADVRGGESEKGA
jgi:hypothetical protein